MYLNNVTLTGFIGADAAPRTTKNNADFTVFSLATKKSWKDRETGEWTSRTDWHRAVVFGRLAGFAASLKKGDYVVIQGEIRTREYTPFPGSAQTTRSLTEVRVKSIVRLDRPRREKPPKGGFPFASETSARPSARERSEP